MFAEQQRTAACDKVVSKAARPNNPQQLPSIHKPTDCVGYLAGVIQAVRDRMADMEGDCSPSSMLNVVSSGCAPRIGLVFRTGYSVPPSDARLSCAARCGYVQRDNPRLRAMVRRERRD